MTEFDLDVNGFNFGGTVGTVVTLNMPFTADVVCNILGHVKAACVYCDPTGKPLETAVYRGLSYFYPDARALGSPSTIVDVGFMGTALDIKGKKDLKIKASKRGYRTPKSGRTIAQTIPNYGKVTICYPDYVYTPVRRPSGDLKGFQGDPMSILTEQVAEYSEFANRTMAKDGYCRLYSLVLLYGYDEVTGIKSVFLTTAPFSTTKISTATTSDSDKKTKAYYGYDVDGNKCFSIEAMNAGSVNSIKRFRTDAGWLMTWKSEESTPHKYTKEELEKECAISII